MKKMEALVFIVSILIVFSILVLFSNQQKEINETESQPLCKNGLVAPCYLGNCEGKKTCESGRWSECKIELICISGSIKPCVIDNCVRTYKICNECGTGYSECLPLEKIRPYYQPA